MMSSRFTQSQPHPHWHMPLTSNTRRACLLAEQRLVPSTVASKQIISECRLHFSASSIWVKGFLQLWLASAIKLCFVFSFDAVNQGTQVYEQPRPQRSQTQTSTFHDTHSTQQFQEMSSYVPKKNKPKGNHSQRLPCKHAKHTYLVQLCTELYPILSLPSTPTSLPTHSSSVACTPQREHLLQFREERQDTSPSHW